MKKLCRLDLCSKCYDVEQVLRMTAGPGAEDQQLFQITSSGGVDTTNAGALAVHTTTSGRTFYITDISITSDFSNANTKLIQLEISGGVVIFEAYTSNTAPVDMPGIESQPQSPSNSILAIKWPAQAGHIAYFIAGYEQ
jgi:hypothetical protein